MTTSATLTVRRSSAAFRREFLLSFIEAFWRENWTSPTVREMALALGLASPASMHVYLGRLVDQGHLEVRRVGGSERRKRVLYRTTRSLV